MMLTKVIPSYLYQEYSDDEDLQGFVNAYNTLAQEYLNWFNNLNLPNYTVQTGAALDWVALGIYGMKRPVLPFTGEVGSGVYNEAIYNTSVYNENIIKTPAGFYETTDDIFKRCITWNFYKGDGFQLNINWLKNRIYSFLVFTNGIPQPIPDTYEISITFAPNNIIDINIDSSIAAFAPILESGIISGVLNVPFQYTFNLTY